MKKRRNILTPILYIVLIFVVIFAASTLLSGMNKAEKLSYSQIIELFEKDQVKEFYVEENGKLMEIAQKYGFENVLKITESIG